MSISKEMIWICEICNLQIPIHLHYCLCGGERFTKGRKIYLFNLPSVLLLNICHLLNYTEVICLHILSSFWHRFFTSKKACHWTYFPILMNIEFSNIIHTFTIFDHINIIQADIIATGKVSSQVSRCMWSYWSLKGELLEKMSAEISTYSPSLREDPESRSMFLFNNCSNSQQITHYQRYFDHQNNTHWVPYQCFKLKKKYDFCHFWNNNTILVKKNYLSWYQAINGKKEIRWQLVTTNIQSKIREMQIHGGFVWILYSDTLSCYKRNGKFLRQYKNSEGFSWTCFVIRANFIILYEQSQFCLMIINRKNEKNLLFIQKMFQNNASN